MINIWLITLNIKCHFFKEIPILVFLQCHTVIYSFPYVSNEENVFKTFKKFESLSRGTRRILLHSVVLHLLHTLLVPRKHYFRIFVLKIVK